MANTCRRAARYALLTALAMTLSWLEGLLPLPGLPPGVKPGLANLAVVFALYRLSLKEAAGISLARILLVSMTFGNAYSLAYSLAGATLSLAVMAGLKKWDKFSVVGVSAAGGVCHNLGQLLVAAVVLESGQVGWYLPGLAAGGTAAGIAVGVVGGLLVERVKS